MVMRNGRLRIAPTVIAFAVVEIDEPQALRLEAEGTHLFHPSGHDVAQRLGEKRVFGVVLGQSTELVGKRFSPAYRVRGQMFHLGQKLCRLSQREDLSGIGSRSHPTIIIAAWPRALPVIFSSSRW